MGADPTPRPPTLDEAWNEVEAALPERWYIGAVNRLKDCWRATAFEEYGTTLRHRWLDGTGDTPALALKALAVKLEAQGGD